MIKTIKTNILTTILNFFLNYDILKNFYKIDIHNNYIL